MHHAFYALARHDDIAKFELEDGLVRQAGNTLLAEPSSLVQVVIDVPRERSVDVGADVQPAGFDASLRLSAESESDIRPANLDDLILDVAGVVGAWTITSHELADLTTSWIGNATPGTKLSFLLHRAPGIDLASYDRWLDDALETCLERLENVALRHHAPVGVLHAGANFDSIVEFTLSTEDALNSAALDHAFTPLVGSELLDPASTRMFASVEHRLVPNVNAWETLDNVVTET